MEAEKRNRFDSLIKHCRPTSSQEAKWESCPFDRIVDSEPDPDLDFSSPSPSPSPKPYDPTVIFMVSAPDSGSIDQSTPQDDDEMEFHAPPEQHARSSSEDQNVDAGEPKAVDLGDSLRTVDLSEDTLVNGVNELRKNRFLEEELDNDSVLEKKVVSEEDVELEWDGETMPIGETEPAIIEVEGDKNVNDTEVINLETEEIGEELTTINLGDDSVEKMCKEDVAVGKNGEAQKTRESKGFSETLELSGVSEELVRVSKNCDLGKPSEPEEVVKASENDCMGRNSEHEEVVKVTEGEKVCNETGGDKDMVICMNLEGIDKFKCVNGGSTERKRKERVCGVDGCVGGTCELPLSLKGKEKNNGSRKVVGNVGINNGFFNDLLEVLKPVVLNVDNDSQDVDFLEIAKRRGLTFPRPRWWSP
ncbi:Uncharacterized protein Adt_40257 [Abeliophyllum distichum]|uniref:Uncharacterized protein n=1 Tax=Abeliophyllum distichum TaxID=126358 RepID=A0ABD1QBQ0_9LAMI